MVQFNHSARELTIKLVYYGPGLSGKTTNLKALHERIDQSARGRLLTVDTSDDRTLFFDMMPVFFRTKSGLKVKVKLFTVPGQVIHNATRRIVLQGADGVVFVANSRQSAGTENNAYWKNLQENLRENGFARGDVPIVIQFNKLDLPDAKTPEQIEEVQRKSNEPVFGAIAIRGEGVLETLHGLLRLTYRQLDNRLGLANKFELSEREFLLQIFKNVNVVGTKLEPLISKAQ
ncbi:MAG: GTP-binding protein [Myxococcales bacterium]|jgi:signal recognition particle receptor subunit beta